MSTFKKVVMILFPVFWIGLCSIPASGMEAEDAPTTVTIDYMEELYEAVDFDHQTHSEMYDCSSCHHHTTGDTPQEQTCRKCHANSEASEDVACSACHKQNRTISSPAAKSTDPFIYHIDIPGLKGALHLQCLGCHRSEGGPVGCRECHDFSPAGRKRFVLNN